MKKLLALFLLTTATLFHAGCGSKSDDAAPSYATFTAVPGTFTVATNGAAGYVLSNLQLRIQKGTSGNDVYQFKGSYGSTQTAEVDFVVSQSRAGTGPWAAPTVGTMLYNIGSTTASFNDYTGTGTLSGSGSTYTGSFKGSNSSGNLK